MKNALSFLLMLLMLVAVLKIFAPGLGDAMVNLMTHVVMVADEAVVALDQSASSSADLQESFPAP